MNDISSVNMQSTLIEFLFALLFTESSLDQATNISGSKSALSVKQISFIIEKSSNL